MELVGVDSRGNRTNRSFLPFEPLPAPQPSNEGSRWRLIALRKYTPAICLLESLIIAVFVAYLFFWVPQHQIQQTGAPDFPLPASNHHQQPASPTSSLINGINSIGSRNPCKQRAHDLKFGIKCESKDIAKCQPISDVEKQQSQQTESNPLLATIITTTQAGLRLDTKRVPLKEVRDGGKFKTQLTVYLSQEQQEIIGWGGALSDSSINNILALSTNGSKRLLDDYFGSDGLMFNMVRITIGGSDFSSRFYTNDDIDSSKSDSENTDFALSKFELKEEDLLYKIPLIKYIQDEYAIKGRELKLFASMWSPPLWMKTNEHFNKGYLKGNISSDLDKKLPEERYYQTLAKLKKNFLLAYLSKSIKFWGLTVMNEPIFSVQPFLNFNTMIFPQKDYGLYVAKYLGPILRKDKFLKDIKLIAHDDNRRYLMDYTQKLLDSTEVSSYIDGVSVHGYIDEEYEMMDKISELNKPNIRNFFVLPTELCSAHLPFMEKALIGNWHRGVHYALDIIRSLQHSAAGWVDWNMALDLEGGPGWLGGRLDSPVIVDKGGDAFYKSPMFYVLGHFSRFIAPGSRKLRSTIINDDYDYQFETVTFILPDKENLVTVVLNHNPFKVELNIDLINLKRAQTEGGNQMLHQVICEPNSITTVIYSKNLANH